MSSADDQKEKAHGSAEAKPTTTTPSVRKPTRKQLEPAAAPPPPAPPHSSFHFGVFADKNYPSRRTMEVQSIFIFVSID